MTVEAEPMADSRRGTFFHRVGSAIRSLHRTHGTRGVIFVATVVSVTLSVLTTVAGFAVLGHLEADGVFWSSLAMAALVPAIIAPFVIAGVASLLTQLETANSELRRQSRTDPLTDVLNRRGFFEDATRLFARSIASDRSVLVGVVDVDAFKSINDRLGHERGDAVLVTLAQQLRGAVAGFGTVGRLGGDEFAFAATGSISDLEELRSRLGAACSLVENGSGCIVRASVGSTIARPDEDVDSALGRADAEMYRLKSARTTVAGSAG